MTTAPYLGFTLPSPDAASQRADIGRIATALGLLDAEALRRAGPRAVAGVPPVLDLILTDPMGLPPGVFSRLGTATYYDAAGVLRTAAAGVPRIDHDPATGRCRGLLIEGPATNLLLRSGDITHASWGAVHGGSRTAGEPAPDGTATAALITDSEVTAQYTLAQSVAIPAETASSPRCVSIFMKAGSAANSRLSLVYTGGATRQYTVEVTWTAGAPAVADLSSSLSYGATPCSDGWWRVWVAGAGGPTHTVATVWVQAVGSPNSGIGSVRAWGAQLEAGETPTSYIPTAGGSITRAADVCALTDLAWLNPAEGSLVVEFQTTSSGNNFALQLSDNSYNNRILTGMNSTLTFGEVRSGGSVTLAPATQPARSAARTRVALRWAANSANLAVNGTLCTADTAGALPPSLTRLDLAADHNGSNRLNGWIGRLTVFPRAVTDATLILLSKG